MTDANAAKEAARRLFKRVSYQDGPLGSFQLSSLLSQTYQILKIPFKPTQNDIKIYQQVLDADKDGRVTLKDLQSRAVEYLCSNNLINSISSSVNSQSLYKKLETQSNPKKLNELETPNYSISSYSQFSQPVANYGQYSQNNYQYKIETQPASYSYNYKSSFQMKPEGTQGSLSNFGNQTLYSYEKNSTYSRSGYDQNPSNQASDKSFQYAYTPSNDYNNANYVNQSYGGKNQEYISNQTYKSNEAPINQNNQDYNNSYQNQQAYQYQSNQQQDRPYSENVKQYLSYVGQVFMAYADPVNFTVTEDDVPGLLRDTYAVLGRQGYEPSKQDVQTWMKLCDVNQDGKVQFQEYEYFVVKSLERSGLNLYD